MESNVHEVGLTHMEAMVKGWQSSSHCWLREKGLVLPQRVPPPTPAWAQRKSSQDGVLFLVKEAASIELGQLQAG